MKSSKILVSNVDQTLNLEFVWATNFYKNEDYISLRNEAILMSKFYGCVKCEIHRLNYYIRMANKKTRKNRFNYKDLFYKFLFSFCVEQKRQLLALFALHELQLRLSPRIMLVTFEN